MRSNDAVDNTDIRLSSWLNLLRDPIVSATLLHYLLLAKFVIDTCICCGVIKIPAECAVGGVVVWD